MCDLYLARREPGAKLARVSVDSGKIRDRLGRLLGELIDGVPTLADDASLVSLDLSRRAVEVIEPDRPPRLGVLVGDVVYCRWTAKYWIEDGLLWDKWRPLPEAKLRRREPRRKRCSPG